MTVIIKFDPNLNNSSLLFGVPDCLESFIENAIIEKLGSKLVKSSDVIRATLLTNDAFVSHAKKLSNSLADTNIGLTEKYAVTFLDSGFECSLQTLFLLISCYPSKVKLDVYKKLV